MPGQWSLYQCEGRCKRVFIAVPPSSVWLSSDRPVRCCRKNAKYLRPATEEEVKSHESGLRRGSVVHDEAEKKYINPYESLGVGRRFKK